MNKIICISRDCGSCGHKIAPLLSEALGIPYYDKNLLEKAVEMSKIPKNILAAAEEKPHNPYVLSMIYQGNYSEYYGLSAHDVIFDLEKKVILEMADQSDCIFVGRCADDILKEAGNYKVASLFITAPLMYRVHSIMQRKNFTERQATIHINKVDRARRAYYENYTGKDWGIPSSYDLSLNMESLGMDNILTILKDIYSHL